MTGIGVVGAFLIAIIFSYLVTPFMAYLATKLNLMDHPAKKKTHAHPTPLLGGIAIYFAFIASLSFTIHADKPLIGALIGGTVLIVIGIIDDKYGMLPNIKILGQLVAALIAVKMGVKVVFIKTLAAKMGLGAVFIENPAIAVLFTVVWLIGMTNAFNLLDNLNGLSAGIAGISAFFFGIIACIHKDIPVAIVSFALMGSCFGFLRHNFPKARIFMGDAGSLFLGFILASIAVWGSWKTSSITTSLAIPILILGYPIFDTILVTVKRIIEKRPIYKGGKDHSSHRLAILGFKKKRAVLVLYAVSFALGLAALAMTLAGRYWDFAIMSISLIAMIIFGIRLGKVRIKYKS
jgi:UDP-GlcNAc:undecaprenyl-phosphate GlcNAc-1-phosphate transferase